MLWPRQCLEVRYLIIFQTIWRKNLAERNQHSESYNPFDFFSSSSSPAALASACGSQYDFIPSWSRKPELGHSCRVPANAWRSDFWLLFGEFDAKTLQKGINSGSLTIHSIFFLLDATRKISACFLFSNSSPAALASACGSQYELHSLRDPASRSWAIHAVTPPMLGGQTFDYFSENLTQKPCRKESTQWFLQSIRFLFFKFFSGGSRQCLWVTIRPMKVGGVRRVGDTSWLVESNSTPISTCRQVSRCVSTQDVVKVPANAWRSDVWLRFGNFDAKTLQKGINSGSLTIHSISFLYKTQTVRFQPSFSFQILLRRLSPVLVGRNTISFPSWSRKPELGHSCRFRYSPSGTDVWLLFFKIWPKKESQRQEVLYRQSTFDVFSSIIMQDANRHRMESASETVADILLPARSCRTLC